MATDHKGRISRRGLLAGLIFAPAMLPGAGTAASQSKPVTPIDLGDGLEIRDYRLFPTKDVMRFIVEIHNTTNTAIDTPAVGVVLPHLNSDSFGWANPVSPVLHAQSSGCLIGVAPMAIKTDEDWSTPDFLLCNSIENRIAESIEAWRYEYSHSIEIVSDTQARTTVRVTNHSREISRQLILQGLVRDSSNRLAGSLLPISLSGVAPGETKELVVNSIPSTSFLANPFALIDSVVGVENSFSVQPRGPAINGGCSPVMPWNR